MINTKAAKIDTTKLVFTRVIAKTDFSAVALFRYHEQDIIVKRGAATSEDTTYHESCIMEKLDHTNIVKYYGFTLSQRKVPRILMEYVSHSLEQLLLQDEMLNDTLHDKAIVNENHWKIAMGISAGLRYLHEQLIVHCDLKPANVLASNDYHTIKICDFGLSSDLSKIDKTAVKWNKGTARWLAPEIAHYLFDSTKAAPKDPYKIDIWALGQILLQLYINTDGKPYRNVDLNKQFLNLCQDISKGKHDDIPQDKPLTMIIAACLIKNPEERSDSKQLVQALETVKNQSMKITT